MSWPGFSIRHRYTVFAALIAVIVFGITARFELPVQLFPNTDPPVVTVITRYPGVAGTDVAKNVSKVLEEEVGGIDGIRRVVSTSQTGLSVVKAEFDYSRAVEEAAMDVQNSINRIRNLLPAGIDEPQVLQFSSSDKPIMTVALSSKKMKLSDIRELADNVIKDRLQLVKGVAAIDVFGSYKRQIEVAVHRDRLRAYGLDMNRVLAALQGWNLTEPGGRINLGRREAVIRFDAPLQDKHDIAKLVVAQHGDLKVLLGDIAQISLTPKERRSAYHFNGKAAIAVQIMKREEANTLEVAKRLRSSLALLEQKNPDLKFSIADDDSVFTELVISNMTSTVLMAILLTIFVILLFMANFRQAAIVAVCIPIAFLMTFALMLLANIDLNMVTMSAIILSIGLLVDDSIVVLENVHRHLTDGLRPIEAAIKGTEEIFLADLSGSVTTIAVLIPLIFLGGFVGRLFGPLAWTLTFALTSSFLISVTLIPLLTALWLKPEPAGHDWLERLLFPFTYSMEGLRKGYLVILEVGLNHPKKILSGAFVLLIISFYMMSMIGSEMLPKFDSGTFQVILDTTPGTRLDNSLSSIKAAEKIILAEKEVVSLSTQVGYEPGSHYLGSRGAMDTNQAEMTVNLTKRTSREETLWKIMDRVRHKIQQLPGFTLVVVKEKGGTARSTTTAPIDLRLAGPDLSVLNRLGDDLLEKLDKIPGISNLYKSWGLDTPELNVIIDRNRASELGLTGKEIARKVYQAMQGQFVTAYKQERSRDLDIFLRYHENDRLDASDLKDVHLQAPDGRQIPLRDLAHIETRLGPRIVSRENYQLTLDVLGYHYGRPLSDVTKDISAMLPSISLPEGYSLSIAGEQTDFQEARKRMMRALLIGIMVVYLVLVAQFQSFKHPLIIMMAVPLQFIGVALALLLAGKYLSMPALLGVILLTGTVVNNSIILIDYILTHLKEGVELRSVIRESVAVRYRPIMMTALSDVAGMLPLALEMAVGAERFSPIAVVVIGGILAATFLTLIIIPVMFMLLES